MFTRIRTAIEVLVGRRDEQLRRRDLEATQRDWLLFCLRGLLIQNKGSVTIGVVTQARMVKGEQIWIVKGWDGEIVVALRPEKAKPDPRQMLQAVIHT